MRLLLIGLDSLDPMVARSDKNFSKVQIQSIKSVESVNTQEAWTTIYTGLEPEQHGIYTRMRFLKEPWDQAPKYLTFFEVLKKEGFKVGLIGMPMTYSSFIPEYGEFTLAGFPMPLPDHRNKSSLYFPQITASIANSTYYPYLWHDAPRKKKTEINYKTLLLSVNKELQKVNLAEDIIDALNIKLDILCIGFQFGDICSHCRAVMPVEETYKYLHLAMKKSMMAFKADITIVISDHGIGIRNWEGKLIFDRYLRLTYDAKKKIKLSIKPHRRNGSFISFGAHKHYPITHIKEVYDVIMDIFDIDNSRIARTTRQIFSIEEEESIRGRLRDLGYLD